MGSFTTVQSNKIEKTDKERAKAMKRDIAGMTIVLLLICLSTSYLEINFYTMLGVVVFICLVTLLLNRIFDALKWPMKSDLSRKELYVTLLVPAIIALPLAILVTHFFPPEKKRKPEAALTLPQLEEPRTAQPPAED
ncbi:MAG: hypothetical protein M2R45_00142 [Verrucomicrobia subdivision 3 bacterium]|nr:hypothetical protein [Limisphaerales bacterium]MCS1412398.1 hypothetical protein [Limisphaerales bacterium]